MKHPIQKVVTDEHGTVRFVGNPIVRYLLDHGKFDMNHLAIAFSGEEHREDEEQFAQLIGYSVSGWGDLSYVSDEAWELANSPPEED